MVKSQRVSILFILMLTALLSGVGFADIIDAPHNASNDMVCSDCHSYSLWWQYSPFAFQGTFYEITIAGVCNQCHDSADPTVPKEHSSAAMANMHRSGLGDWSVSCSSCHDPHFQDQLNYAASQPNDLNLIMAVVTTGTLTDNGDNTSTIDYESLTVNKAAWADPATWAAKTINGRGLILVYDDGVGRYTYEINTAAALTADTGTIELQGVLPLAAEGQTISLIYGQLIRSVVETGTGERDVRFFDPNGPVGGFVDETPVNPSGLCQVCHTSTHHFNVDGSGGDPAHTNIGSVDSTTNCLGCHAHEQSFAHSGDGGHPSCAAALCHDSGEHAAHFGTVEPANPPFNFGNIVRGPGYTCSRCHELNNMFNGSGQIILNVQTTPTCDVCHVNAAGGAPNQTAFRTDWGGGSDYGCTGCHDNPPMYPSGSPKANSHPTHIFSCEKCHYTTTVTGTDLAYQGTHNNSVFDVSPFVGGNISFNYTYNANGGSCASISCHGNHNATWGTSVSLGCDECHFGAGDVQDYVFNDGIQAKIDGSEWLSSGHGRATGNYVASGNPAAGLTCEYCHGGSHDDPTNPYRLVNMIGIDGMNGVCLICHKTGAAGYDPDGAGILPLKIASTKADSYHFGTKHSSGANGGLFCWDCHDPHGEANIYMIRDMATKQSDGVFGIPTASSPVVFSSDFQGSDYAKTEAPFNGICNACHTTTSNYGETYGFQHWQTRLCTECHLHDGTTANAGFEPQATVVGMGGTLLREDGNPMYETPVYFKEPGSGTVLETAVTDNQGNWLTLVPEACYDIEPAQAHRYETYFYPASLNSCTQPDLLDIQFVADPKPEAPLLVDEKNHSNLVGTSTMNILLEWGAVVDQPAGDPIEYEYQVSTSSTFSSLVASGTITGTSVQFIGNAGWTYLWRVRARETLFPNRDGGFSAADSFRINPPGVDCQHDPTNCANGADF